MEKEGRSKGARGVIIISVFDGQHTQDDSPRLPNPAYRC